MADNSLTDNNDRHDALTRLLAEYDDPRTAFRNPLLALSKEDYQRNPWALPPPPPVEPKAEFRAYRRPDDPFLAGVREYVGPDAVAKGSYGMGQLLADTYGKAREGDLSGVGGNLPELLGIFAGPRAKTANHAMLARAQEMAQKGAPREAIWKDTGWFQGRDGNWRWEIDDSASRWPKAMVDQFGETGKTATGTKHTLGAKLLHQELHAAYPEAKYIPYLAKIGRGESEGGTFVPSAYGRGAPAGAEMDVRGPTLEKARSADLHEKQHFVQDVEGFSPGSSIDANHPNTFPAEHASEMARILSLYGDPNWRSFMASNALYRRHAGEVESRNVQKRRDMTPEERRARPPWETEDMPWDQQIVDKPR